MGEGLAGSVLIEPFPHQLEAEKKWIPTWRPSRPHGCVTADDLLKAHPEVLPVRPQVGIAPKISDAEILTLAVMGPCWALTVSAAGSATPAATTGTCSPTSPANPATSKRLRTLTSAMCWLTCVLASQCSVYTDDLWLVDSTPVECGRSRETVKRSDLAGWAGYG